MPEMAGNEQYFTLADGNVDRPAALDAFQHHVAAQLEEKLLVRVVVVVSTRIRSADHLHDKVLRLAEYELVADGGLEQVGVLVYPAAEVEGGERQSKSFQGILE